MTAKQKMRSTESIDEMVDRWTQKSGDNQHLSATRDLLRYLSSELYDCYQPFAEKPPFWERLGRWLNNVTSEADQQRLFEFVPWLLFIGQSELETMYRAAFAGPITRWIIDEARLDISAPNLTERFADELRQTFFGSIAGMDINSFVRVNGLAGQSHRPNFREHSQLGDYDRFRQEVEDLGYRRFVAVEDMVGTGTQMVEAAPILTYLAPKRALLCPIVVAPAGVDTWNRELKQFTHFSFAPLFLIPDNATLPEKKTVNSVESAEAHAFRILLKKTWSKVKGSDPSSQLYGPFGFGDFGSLVLSYLNCPDNVPPLVHYESDKWKSLFPRLSREG